MRLPASRYFPVKAALAGSESVVCNSQLSVERILTAVARLKIGEIVASRNL